MDTSKLRKFASFARSALIEQVGTRLKTVLSEKSLARRESPKVVEELEKKIKDLGENRVIEMVAYTWFNRFCALRYMDVNRYTRIGVLSPADGQFQPEILAEAKMGHIDEELVPEATRKQVMRLLDGSDKSADPQGEAYRLLLVAVCNYYHSLMPFMFEKIADYTELLLPDDLLSGTSLPAYTREALLPINSLPQYIEDFKESVEVIGWLYQFYVADKKDEVFDGLKKGTKIKPENIPAATQLFTPHWIVRYLVENSLGRLWMLNHPESKLAERMDYYIKPEGPETEFLKITSPEEIKVCDPACGSGHMLTYAFDLLYEIYREEQYPEAEIPSLILKNNLYGIEIDPRAGALAAFALTMKAREKDKRFFTRKPQPEASARDSALIENQKSKIQNPNICVLENIKIDPDDLSAYMDKVGRDLFTDGLQCVVNQWEEADNFGSLIRPLVTDVSDVLELLRERQMGQDLFLAKVHQQVLSTLRQAHYLSPIYHVVVANPPYMGGGGMNAAMKEFVGRHFPETKSDLFAAFVERLLEFAPKGTAAIMTPFTWMFLKSYEALRSKLLGSHWLSTLVRPEYHAFFDSAFVPLCAFVACAGARPKRKGAFIDLNQFYGAEIQPVKAREAIENSACSWFHLASTEDFQAIAGTPIAYWLSDELKRVFRESETVGKVASPKKGLDTGDNDRFLRFWPEVSFNNIETNCGSVEDSIASSKTWYPINRGGGFRRWYGNNEYVIHWKHDGREIKSVKDKSGKTRANLRSESFYFRESVTWGAIGSSSFSARFCDPGGLFGAGGYSVFGDHDSVRLITGLFGSNLADHFLKVISPTLNFEAGNIASIPFVRPSSASTVVDRVAKLIDSSRTDWNSFEISRNFAAHPLSYDRQPRPLSKAATTLRKAQSNAVANHARLETENNESLISTFGLENELDKEVSREKISLLCNPAYRYDSGKSEDEYEALFLADMMREYISYAVGCMFGRYSLNKPGLILANQGETAADFNKQIPEPTFAPDEDNVIPILEGEWFSDDISQRFKDFLKVTFGSDFYEENVEFLENALYPDNPSAKKRKTIRDYFLKEFFEHHLKMYKKRPIYWLFSSPKGTFNALIYMHRYRPETVGKVLECLRDYRDKLAHHAEHRQMTADSASASKTEKTQAVKEVAAIKKQLKELEEYEKTLFEVAAKKISIDLDDGVKHNYPLFGSVLRKIPGLDAKDD